MFRLRTSVLPIVYSLALAKSVGAFGIVRPAGVAKISSGTSQARLSALFSQPDSTVMILGPPLPSQDTTTKRLFLVRHGEVINPGAFF